MSKLEKVFGGDKNLLRRIGDAIDTDSARPGDTTLTLRPLFEEIADFYLKSLSQSDTHDGGTGPAAKKRKLENGSLPVQNQPRAENAKAVFELKDVSFSIPQRKKFHFQIKQSADSEFYLYIANTATADTEYTISTSKITHVLRLPVPEKAQKQFNYIFLPKVESGLDSMLFTIPAGPAIENLDAGLKSTGLSVTEPSPAEFASAIPEAHRKNEKAYHVKAFRGSKDGFLFFLSTCIFFGFKKPLFFVALEDLQSLAYTSILQRTFNIVITYKENNSDEEKEVEFSMLDQPDYAGINDYVQRHGLNDASLAEARKAKIGKDKNRRAATNGDANDEDDGRTELEKAEAQLQDEEDENEEDFVLGSDDADSDGSGESDDEYDEEGDLVKQELGSEAEDASEIEEEDEEVDDEEEEEEEVVEEPKPAKQTIVVPSRSANEPDPEDDDQL